MSKVYSTHIEVLGDVINFFAKLLYLDPISCYGKGGKKLLKICLPGWRQAGETGNKQLFMADFT